MTDANEVDFEMGPPLSEAEAELIWYAPAGGLTTSLLIVLFLDLAIVVVLLASQLFLMAVALLAALALLVGFSLVNAAHLVGPGGITVQRPFGTESHPWGDFGGWTADGDKIIMHRSDDRSAPLRVQTRGKLEELSDVLRRHLPETPGAASIEGTSADG